jgi:tripartite-type tricarboxylate transporter receptor subunit TctC
MSPILGQRVVVENVGGGGGTLGGQRVAHAAPDGYTTLLGTIATHANPQLYSDKPLYDPLNDFVNVALIAEIPLVVIVRKEFQANTFQEFMAYAKANQDKMTYGSAGAGSATHLGCVLLDSAMGTKIQHVPYRGSAPGLIDTIAGRHAFQMDTLGSSKGFIDGGKARVLAVAADKRLKQLPDVPTVEEAAGFKFSINTWYVAQAPAATPRAIIDKLNTAFNKALASPEAMKRMDELAIEPVQSTPAQAKAFFDGQMAFWDPIVKASGAKAE